MPDYDKLMDHPSWGEAGWESAEVRVLMRDQGIVPVRGWTHPLAAGLAVTLLPKRYGRLSVTHVPSGLNAGLISESLEWPPCPVALRNYLSAACAILDYGSLSADDAPKTPPEIVKRAKAAVQPLLAHSCPVCSWWAEEQLPDQIAEAEQAVKDAQREVQHAEDALADAVESHAEAVRELAVLRARLGGLR